MPRLTTYKGKYGAKEQMSLLNGNSDPVVQDFDCNHYASQKEEWSDVHLVLVQKYCNYAFAYLVWHSFTMQDQFFIINIVMGMYKLILSLHTK